MFAVTLAAAVYVCGLDTKAMHIMEGYLPAGYCIAWGAVCLPFLAAGYLRIRKLVREQKKALILLAMSGAFIFVISSLKIPSVTGSCSHMTGTGLGAILFGPSTVSILGIIVLVFQAVLLAHGGLTTLGANTFSMAIAGPLFSFGIYKLGIRFGWNRKAVDFCGCFSGRSSDLLRHQHPAGACLSKRDGRSGSKRCEVSGCICPDAAAAAVLEGILTVLIVIGMESFAAPELRAIGFFRKEKTNGRA